MKTEPVKAIVAVGVRGHAVVLATNSLFLVSDIDELQTDNCEDLDMRPAPDEVGLYWWEGVMQRMSGSWEAPHETDIQYRGQYRAASTDEIAGLLMAFHDVRAALDEVHNPKG